MALSRIPQFRPVTPEEASPLYAAMKTFLPMYQQAQQMQMQKQGMQQQQQQLGLKNQLAQMQADRDSQMAPFKQRKLEAETGLAEAKTAGFPQQAQQQQAKSMLAWAQHIEDINSKDPNWIKAPENQQDLAIARKIQHGFPGNMQGGQQQPMQGQQIPSQSAMQPQMAPQKGLTNLTDLSQAQLSPEYSRAIEEDQAAKKGKQIRSIYPEQQIQRVQRINAAKERYDAAGEELKEILPYLSPGQSTSMIAQNMAKTLGIPVSEANIKVNTFFKKTIKGIAKELAPGLGIPTTEKAQEQFFRYFDPSSFGSPEQIMSNWNEVGNMINSVGKQLSMTPEQQIAMSRKLFDQKVPRETQDDQSRNTINYGGKTYTREQLMKIAAGGQ